MTKIKNQNMKKASPKKIKKLKIYGRKDEFEGFIAEIYVKNNKVIIESKDKAIKEILEKEINKGIGDKDGLPVSCGGIITNISINGVKVQFNKEGGKELEIKILEDENGKAKNLLKEIDKIQKDFWDKLEEMIKKDPFYRSKLVEKIVEGLEAKGYKVKTVKGGSHWFGSRFIKISDEDFINEAIKSKFFAQWEDNFGNYHPALAAKIRDNLGYKIIQEKSLVVEE